MRHDDVRAEFASVLLDLRGLKLNYADPGIQRLLQHYVEDLRASLKQLSPRARVRRPPTPSTAFADAAAPGLLLEKEAGALSAKIQKLDPARSAQILDVWWPQISARADELYAQQAQLKKRLEELAPEAAIHQAGPEGYWHLLDSRRDGDYRSQGYSAAHYAQGSVQLTADVARAEGFVDGEDLLVLRFDEGRYHEGWLVAVRVENELDVQILRRSPGPSLREQVRLCWKRGVNPRVFNPWLPHNFEADTGLDYFGNDRKAQAGGTVGSKGE